MQVAWPSKRIIPQFPQFNSPHYKQYGLILTQLDKIPKYHTVTLTPEIPSIKKPTPIPSDLQ